MIRCLIKLHKRRPEYWQYLHRHYYCDLGILKKFWYMLSSLANMKSFENNTLYANEMCRLPLVVTIILFIIKGVKSSCRTVFPKHQCLWLVSGIIQEIWNKVYFISICKNIYSDYICDPSQDQCIQYITQLTSYFKYNFKHPSFKTTISSTDATLLLVSVVTSSFDSSASLPFQRAENLQSRDQWTRSLPPRAVQQP